VTTTTPADTTPRADDHTRFSRDEAGRLRWRGWLWKPDQGLHAYSPYVRRDDYVQTTIYVRQSRKGGPWEVVLFEDTVATVARKDIAQRQVQDLLDA
jgi:hypothetical protein